MEQSKVGNWLQQLIKTEVRNMIIRKWQHENCSATNTKQHSEIAVYS